MTYLIALIIAIALGAVIALLSFTNIGSGFAGQSAAANAQQFANAVSQLEIAAAAHEASAGDYAAASSQDLAGVVGLLQDENWLRADLQAPQAVTDAGGSLTLNADGQLAMDNVPTQVCDEIVELGLNCVDGDANSNEISEGLAEVVTTP